MAVAFERGIVFIIQAHKKQLLRIHSTILHHSCLMSKI